MLEAMIAKKKTEAEPTSRVTRVSAALLERVERLAEVMGKQLGGDPLPQQYVVNTALERGLSAIEDDLRKRK